MITHWTDTTPNHCSHCYQPVGITLPYNKGDAVEICAICAQTRMLADDAAAKRAMGIGMAANERDKVN